MATVKQLMEGQEFINSLLNSLPSHRQVARRHLPPNIQALLPAEPVRAARPTPPPAPQVPRAQPAPQPGAPVRPAAAPRAQAQNLGDPGIGTKKTRFNAMYRQMNGTGMSRNAFMDAAIQRLEMTRAGATTYMANAARDYGAWRLA
jgi:hypothetical protein